jgi:hypothetical protein
VVTQHDMWTSTYCSVSAKVNAAPCFQAVTTAAACAAGGRGRYLSISSEAEHLPFL